MQTEKDKFLSLLKTHINYISLIILIFGLTLKYSLPSLFPLLKRFDFDFFGCMFVEFGIFLFVGNWLVDRYKEKINRELFTEIINEKIGIKNRPLLTELINIIQPFPYTVTSHKIDSHIKKTNVNQKNYDVIQTINVKLIPKQDNVYYRFGMGISVEENKEPKIIYVKLNGKELILSENIIPTKFPYIQNPRAKSYQITIPLKKEQEYQIEIKTLYPDCMSSLDSGEESDNFEYTFFALTERTSLKHKIDFPNFKKYNFRVEKRSMNLPDITDIEYDIPTNTNEVNIESTNLKNGDKIYLIYSKKKS